MNIKLYDAEIEYLEVNSAGPYINTGLDGKELLKITIECAITENTSSGYECIFGYWDNNTSYQGLFQILFQNSHLAGPGGRNQYSLSDISTSTIWTPNVYYTFTATQTRVTQSSLTAYLFCRNNGAAAAYVPCPHLKIKSVKLWRGSVFERDLIPVRVGNVGYLYDKVSGQLFGNSGTGSFVLGPDVAPGRYANEIAFLESTGSQYIDLGVKANQDSVFELEFMATPRPEGQGVRVFGAREAWNQNAFAMTSKDATDMMPSFTYDNVTASADTLFPTINLDDGHWHTAKSNGQGHLQVDDVSKIVTFSNFTTPYNILLFGFNNGGTILGGCVKIRRVVLNNMQLIPVEYNNIGYLYDKVSGKFFANQGTGKFVLGHRAPRFDGKACARSYTRRQLMAKAPVPWKNQYLTFIALQTGTFKLTTNAVEYSLNGGSTWATLTANTNSPTVNAGETIMWRGTLSPASNVGVGTFSATGNFEAKGNPASLLFGSAFLGKKSLSGKNYAFYNLFKNNTKLKDISDMYLVATTLSEACYYGMFYGCTSLIHGITELPATILAANCYYSMFEGCSSMTSIPSILPAPTVNNYACFRMFYGCRAITVAPEIYARTVRTYSLANMFMYCTNLTTPPSVLNITSFGGDRSCGDMFDGCTKLASAPELPATTLRTDCYSNMFRSCTSLVIAPVLPATTLATRCYQSMFNGCSKLAYVKAMFTTTPGSSYTNTWLNGVASSGTFVKNSAATWDVTGTSGIPSGWTVQTADE